MSSDNHDEMKAKRFKGMEFFDHNEDLHEIGRIQDQGYVIAICCDGNLPHGTIVAVSENLKQGSWLDVSNPADLINKTVFQLFDLVIANMFISLIRRYQAISRGMEHVDVAARNYQLIRMANPKQNSSKDEETVLYCSVVGCSDDNIYIFDLEDITEMAKVQSEDRHPICLTGELSARVKNSKSFEEVTATFLDSVMGVMPGYDRGMVYRFGDDNSGHVIYEKIRNPSVVQSSYLGLRFPAEDIPPQARLLFLKNGVRFLYNSSAEDSRIISLSGMKLDLSMSCLRGASKCHLKYLLNMGVVASMNIAIVIDGALWGLYVFHSYSKPVKPTVEERVMFDMVGSITSMRIQDFMREQNDSRRLELKKLCLAMPTMRSVHEFLMINSAAVLRVIDAHAIIFYDQEQKVIYGDESIVPSPDGYDKLRAAAKENILLHVNNFTEGLTGLGGGVLFYTHQYMAIAFIRKSRVSDVMWGGKPDVPRDPDIPVRLSPRVSFEIYIEQARRECRSWSTIDLELAQYFMDRVIEYMMNVQLAFMRLSLEQANSECFQAKESATEHYEFFAHMSHELRTPFHGVMSSLQILDTGGKLICDAERKEMVKSALECGKTMLRTLDDILTIAKSCNNVDVVRSPVLIGKAFASTRRMMSPIAEHKLITFAAVIAEIEISSATMTASDFNSMVVLSDETRLGQISNNLTNNAIKFTPSGGQVTITARILPSVQKVLQVWSSLRNQFAASYMSRDPKDGSRSSLSQNILSDAADVWYVFSVQDSGCGVKKEDMDKMFDAYKQLSTGVSKTYQGTGLGLHICRLHIELMGGMLGIASTFGQGTLFLYAVPVTYHGIIDESPLISPKALSLKEHSNIENAIFLMVSLLS
jgi:two-component system, chemotaxis family, sensor kinase Cph1